jgi:hypothetical protein
MLNVKPLTRERFNAFASWTKSPIAADFGTELDWYSDNPERVIGAVVLDHSDMDFGYVVLGRDEAGRFRCFEPRFGFRNEGMARSSLKKALRKWSETGQSVFPQGDPAYRGVDLFAPVVAEQRQHPSFKLMGKHSNWTPAVGILTEMMKNFVDVDGNFVEQFQTTGFDSRIWELYLYAYLVEEGLFVDRPKPAPDFLVNRYGKRVFVEAVTVNPTDGEPMSGPRDGPPGMRSQEEIKELLKGKMPIKFGSALYSKLSREKPYWELPAVAGQPLVFAIADFHEPQSMTWSSSALFEYLYGVTHEFTRDEDGRLLISPLEIEYHEHEGKKIRSGFFYLPAAENVSAVLFSSSGTISKFNRMGRLAGFGVPNLMLIRHGVRHDHDPNASLPRPFAFSVTPGTCTETWGEGLSLFHNPNARFPVPEDMFPSIAHHKFVDGQIQSVLPEFHPYASMTLNVLITG